MYYFGLEHLQTYKITNFSLLCIRCTHCKIRHTYICWQAFGSTINDLNCQEINNKTLQMLTTGQVSEFHGSKNTRPNWTPQTLSNSFQQIIGFFYRQ